MTTWNWYLSDIAEKEKELNVIGLNPPSPGFIVDFEFVCAPKNSEGNLKIFFFLKIFIQETF